MRRFPTSLLLSFALAGLGTVCSLWLAITPFAEVSMRWQLAANGLPLCESVCFVAGLFAVARRLHGRSRLIHHAAVLAAIAMLCNVLLSLTWSVLGIEDWSLTLQRFGYFGHGLLMLAIAALLAMTAKRTPVAAGVIVIAILARGWIPGVFDDFHEWLWKHRFLGACYWSLLDLAWIGGVLRILSKLELGQASADPSGAARGFERVAWGLKIRIAASVGLAVLGVGLLQSASMLKFVMIGGPVLVLASTVAVALGVLRVLDAGLEGMPRGRLVVGTVLVMWWSSTQFQLMLATYRETQSAYGGAPAYLEHWSILGPLIAIAGFALIGSAISAFALTRDSEPLREAASVRTVIFVILSASSVGLQSQVARATSREGVLMLAFVAAVAGIGALISFAGLAREAAIALEGPTALPAARVVE